MDEEGDIYSNLPDDPELAFVHLESAFRRTCQGQIQTMHQDENVAVFWVEYMGRVIAAIEALGLEAAFDREVPSIDNIGFSTYADFGKDVDHYTTKLRIQHARRAKGFSVRLDDVAKSKINHWLAQLREFFGKLELNDERKRDSLMSKLDALQLEVDRSRTRLEVYGDLVVEAAGIAGAVGEKLEPWRKLLDSIAGVLWGQRQEEQKQLPPPPPQRRIEPPRKKPPSMRDGIDEEIPF